MKWHRTFRILLNGATLLLASQLTLADAVGYSKIVDLRAETGVFVAEFRCSLLVEQ